MRAEISRKTMLIPEFWVGVASVLLVELAAVVLLAVVQYRKDKK